MSSLDFKGLVNYVLGIFNLLVPVLIGIALIAFFVGLIRYIYETDSSNSHKEGRELIQWGLVAMFCLVYIWGIIGFIRVAFLGS